MRDGEDVGTTIRKKQTTPAGARSFRLARGSDWNNAVNASPVSTCLGTCQSQLELSRLPRAGIAQNNQHPRFRLAGPQ